MWVGALSYNILPMAFHCRICIVRAYWPCGFCSAVHKHPAHRSASSPCCLAEKAVTEAESSLVPSYSVRLLTLLCSRADLEIKWLFFSYLLVTRVQENIILKVSPCATHRGNFSVHSFLLVASPTFCLKATDVEHVGIVCCRLFNVHDWVWCEVQMAWWLNIQFFFSNAHVASLQHQNPYLVLEFPNDGWNFRSISKYR